MSMTPRRDAMLVIHVATSANVSSPDWHWIRAQGRVIVNPRRYQTSADITGQPSLHCNVLRAHMSNMKFAFSDPRHNFTHVILKASNECDAPTWLTTAPLPQSALPDVNTHAQVLCAHRTGGTRLQASHVVAHVGSAQVLLLLPRSASEARLTAAQPMKPPQCMLRSVR